MKKWFDDMTVPERRSMVQRALDRTGGNVTAAAELLGANRSTLAMWIGAHATNLRLPGMVVCERCGHRQRRSTQLAVKP